MTGMEQICSRSKDYREILYWVVLLKPDQKVQVLLKVNKNNRHFARIPSYIYEDFYKCLQ
jgi:hypothetical protein